jgi:hypothetical protein
LRFFSSLERCWLLNQKSTKALETEESMASHAVLHLSIPFAFDRGVCQIRKVAAAGQYPEQVDWTWNCDGPTFPPPFWTQTAGWMTSALATEASDRGSYLWLAGNAPSKQADAGHADIALPCNNLAAPGGVTIEFWAQITTGNANAIYVIPTLGNADGTDSCPIVCKVDYRYWACSGTCVTDSPDQIAANIGTSNQALWIIKAGEWNKVTMEMTQRTMRLRINDQPHIEFGWNGGHGPDWWTTIKSIQMTEYWTTSPAFASPGGNGYKLDDFKVTYTPCKSVWTWNCDGTFPPAFYTQTPTGWMTSSLATETGDRGSYLSIGGSYPSNNRNADPGHANIAVPCNDLAAPGGVTIEFWAQITTGNANAIYAMPTLGNADGSDSCPLVCKVDYLLGLFCPVHDEQCRPNRGQYRVDCQDWQMG